MLTLSSVTAVEPGSRTVLSMLSRRDVALLRAVAAGRCKLAGRGWPVLLVDGLCCCDQAAAHRLTAAGLIGPGELAGAPVPAELTAAGRALLAAA